MTSINNIYDMSHERIIPSSLQPVHFPLLPTNQPPLNPLAFPMICRRTEHDLPLILPHVGLVGRGERGLGRPC